MSHLEKRRVDFPEYDPHVFPLQPRGSKTPLFIVPGIEGKCFYLNELAKSFGLDQPVYGLQYVGLIKGEKPFDSIEQMAAFNIGLMKRLQPQGPYLLAGHSMGGWVAMEMAHQLHQQGEKIGFLGLLDSYSPKVHAVRGGFQIHSKDQEINDLLMLAERLLEYSGSTANFLKLKESLAQTDSNLSLSNLHQWTVSNGLIPSDFSMEDLGQWAKLIGTNSRIQFEPKKTAESTTLFKAAENNHVEQPIPDCLGWSATVSHLYLQETPGNHFSMMYHPHVTSLAAAIQDCIQSDGRNPETVKKSEQNERPKRALEYQESKF
jgi:thioesterase domain-containing protein